MIAARDRQRVRLAPFGIHCNAEMTTTILRATCRLDAATEAHLARIVERKMTFTARSIDRLLKVARTTADLDDRDEITIADLDEKAASHRDVDPLASILPRITSKRPVVLQVAAPVDDPVIASYLSDINDDTDDIDVRGNGDHSGRLHVPDASGTPRVPEQDAA